MQERDPCSGSNLGTLAFSFLLLFNSRDFFLKYSKPNHLSASRPNLSRHQKFSPMLVNPDKIVGFLFAVGKPILAAQWIFLEFLLTSQEAFSLVVTPGSKKAASTTS